MTNIKPYHNAFDETAVTSAGALFTKLKGTQCEHNQLQIRSKHSESAENSSVCLVESIKWVIWSWSPTKLFFFTSACFMEKNRIIEILFCLNNSFVFFFFFKCTALSVPNVHELHKTDSSNTQEWMCTA